MMLDKSQFEQFSFLSSKWDVEQQRQTCNINNAFGSGTANECTVQWWFKKQPLQRRFKKQLLCKEDKSLEDEGVVAGHWMLTVTN